MEIWKDIPEYKGLYQTSNYGSINNTYFLTIKKLLITKEIEIDMAHRVPNHKSKCRNLHGHRYKIEVGVDDKIITETGSSDEGMVIDFGDLKQIMIEEIDKKFDHGCVFYEEDPIVGYVDNFVNFCETDPEKVHFVNFIPTAENLAKHWFGLIKEPLYQKGIFLSYVKIWETPTSTALCTWKDYNEYINF